MGDSVSYSVDLEALDLLRGHLGDVVSGMASIGAASAGYSPLDLGPDSGVLNALQSFDAAWSYGLSLIRDNVGSLLPKLALASENYRLAEIQNSGMAVPRTGAPG